MRKRPREAGASRGRSTHDLTLQPTNSLLFASYGPQRHLTRIPDPVAERTLAQLLGDIGDILVEQRDHVTAIEPAQHEQDRREDGRDDAPLADRVDDEQLEVGQP